MKTSNSSKLNEILSQALADIKEGKINLEEAKSIAMVADKINKNNVNAIQYKKVTGHKTNLTFFEE